MDVTSFSLSLAMQTERRTELRTKSLEPPPTQSEDFLALRQDSVSIESTPLPSTDTIDQFMESIDMQSLEASLSFTREEMLALSEDEDVEDPKLMLLKELYSLNEDKRERRLRQVLREIEEGQDLEKLLFGEPKRKKQEFSFNFQLEVRARRRVQSERTQSGELSVNVQGRFEGETTRSLKSTERADPLIVDLGANGFKTSGLKDGIRFDLDADGKMDQTSFVGGDDFALALDKNRNGWIDSGSELFGDQNGAADGIAELARYDTNGDNRIDSQDTVFKALHLINTDAELSLSEAGVVAIDLAREDVFGMETNGDMYRGGLKFIMQDQSTRDARDYWFQYRSGN